MLVDDLDTNLLVLKHLLESLEVELIEAKSGKAALSKAAQQDNLALAILDVHLGDMDGFEVATQLREDPRHQHVPIIFVSAVHQEQLHILKGYKAGAIDYITKPIVPYILLSKVRIFLQMWQLREDLDQSRAAAQAAAEAKDRFLSTMSHEIRTPMNGVLGVAELLNQTALDDKQKHYVDTILQSGGLLLTILNDILDIAKLEAGKVKLENICFDLRQLCDEVLALLGPNRKNPQVKLELDYPTEQARHFYGDPARIRQILFNLVGNALKFTHKGKVNLAVVLTKSQSDLCEVKLIVEDSGIGIEPDRAARLFQPFNQADVSIARQYGGTGLGLAICNNLTELMGGHLSLQSAPGKGSAFTVTLPLLIASATLPDSAHEHEPGCTVDYFDGHVLLAEDTEINQMVAVSMLEQLGLTVSVAKDGAEAVEVWRHNKPDLILMDCAMPTMNGFDACRTIRAEEADHLRVPVIALTADATSDNEKLCLAAGMDGVITKPFNLNALASRLKPWLSARDHCRKVGL